MIAPAYRRHSLLRSACDSSLTCTNFTEKASWPVVPSLQPSAPLCKPRHSVPRRGNQPSLPPANRQRSMSKNYVRKAHIPLVPLPLLQYILLNHVPCSVSLVKESPAMTSCSSLVPSEIPPAVKSSHMHRWRVRPPKQTPPQRISV